MNNKTKYLKKYCVYKHTNKFNGKVYIGQTNQPVAQRWQKGKGYKDCVYFYKAIQKYGWDNFEHEVLFNDLSSEEADIIEISLIAKYNSTNPEKGYNLKSGGSFSHLSEESKKKIGIAQKGKIVSKETREKISNSLMGDKNPNWGRPKSKETRQKLSEANKGKAGGFAGKHHSLETRRLRAKAVKCLETDSVYYGLREAGRATGLSYVHIGECCRGIRKTCGGFHWEYYELKEGD